LLLPFLPFGKGWNFTRCGAAGPIIRHVGLDLLFELRNFRFAIRVGLIQAETQRIIFPVKGCSSTYLTGFCIEGQHYSGTGRHERFAAALRGLFHLDKYKPLIVKLRRFRLKATTAAE
jgi:hypothetical protein